MTEKNRRVGGTFTFNVCNLQMFLCIYSMRLCCPTLPKLPLPSTLWNTRWFIVRRTRRGGATGAGFVSPLSFPSAIYTYIFASMT